MKGLRVLVLTAVVAVTVPLFGAYEGYLKINGIKGESQDSKHQDWIEVMSFSWGMSNRAATTRATAPSCASNQATFTAKGSPAPQLVKAVVTHPQLDGVLIDFNGQSHVLQNAILSSCQNMGDGSVRCTLNFTRCTTHGAVATASMVAAAPSVSETPNGQMFLGNNPPEAVNLLGLRSQGSNSLIILQRGASSRLMQHCTKGKHFDKVTITMRKAGGNQQQYFTVKLEQVLITGVQRNADGSTALTLNFAKMEGSTAGLESLQ